ncbi:MAG: hypothetical protein QW818_02320 [Candidatus Aenigmatarchaeota archaeon]
MRRLRDENRLYRNVFLGLIVALIVLYGVNIFITSKIISPLKSEKERPANLHLTLITTDCDNCFDMNNIVSFIKRQTNVKVLTEKNLTYGNKEAQQLISKNNIKVLPALVITGETLQDDVIPLWNNIGAKFVGNVVIVSGYPPYYSLETKNVVGLVQVIKITDNSCTECYNVENHMQILPRFGVYIDKSLTYDISSSNGKDLLKKYNITKVPTIILSPDISVYPALTRIWNQVGTVESDGWYVFRATEQMGTYKDLTQNKVVNVT